MADTLVGKDTTDTLTNKALTSEFLNTGVSGAVLDNDDTGKKFNYPFIFRVYQGFYVDSGTTTTYS